MTSLEDQIHYEELEKKIVGGLSVEPSYIPDVAKFLKKEMFSNKKIGRIFQICSELYQEGSDVNELNVTRWIRKNEIQNIDISDVMECMAYSPPTDVKRYARDVAERWVKLQTKKVAERAISSSSKESTDAFELLSDLVTDLEKINDGTDYDTTADTFDRLTDDVISYMDEGIKGVSSGVPSGLTEVDELTNGWQKGDLYIIAGRPGMGKSSIVTTMVKNAADSGFPCALASLEMKAFKVYCRLVAEECEIFVGDLTKRRITPSQFEHFKSVVLRLKKELPIVIDDDQDMSIEKLRLKAREWKRKYKIELLVVDYLQLVEGDSSKGNREQEIARVSRGLKKIAKELDIPVIALSQLSRGVETRDNKRPMMSDLRESGGIEQDADAIFFLYRPEYYANIAGEECPPEYRGVCQLIVGKNRDGSSEDILLKFVAEYSVFRDRDDLNVSLKK